MYLLSKDAAIAIRLLAELTQNACRVHELAEKVGVGPGYAAMILNRLAKHKIITALAQSGGKTYSLLVDPCHTSIAKVIAVFDAAAPRVIIHTEHGDAAQAAAKALRCTIHQVAQTAPNSRENKSGIRKGKSRASVPQNEYVRPTGQR